MTKAIPITLGELEKAGWANPTEWLHPDYPDGPWKTDSTLYLVYNVGGKPSDDHYTLEERRGQFWNTVLDDQYTVEEIKATLSALGREDELIDKREQPA